MADKISIDRLNLLHPKVRPHALAAFQEVETALTGRAKCRIVSTWRTYEEQTALYKLGRTVRNPDGITPKKPLGQVVTNAKAGQSNHNFAVALDFALIWDKDGNGTFESTSWDTTTDFDGDKKSDWMEVVDIFKKHGFKSGADWVSFKDMPHLEYPTGLTLSQMDLRYKTNNVIPGTHYINF